MLNQYCAKLDQLQLNLLARTTCTEYFNARQGGGMHTGDTPRGEGGEREERC